MSWWKKAKKWLKPLLMVVLVIFAIVLAQGLLAAAMSAWTMIGNGTIASLGWGAFFESVGVAFVNGITASLTASGIMIGTHLLSWGTIALYALAAVLVGAVLPESGIVTKASSTQPGAQIDDSKRVVPLPGVPEIVNEEPSRIIVYFDGNGGVPSWMHYVGSPREIVEFPTVARDGFDFKGWSLNGSIVSGNQYTLSTPELGTTITFVAQWAATAVNPDPGGQAPAAEVDVVTVHLYVAESASAQPSFYTDRLVRVGDAIGSAPATHPRMYLYVDGIISNAVTSGTPATDGMVIVCLPADTEVPTVPDTHKDDNHAIAAAAVAVGAIALISSHDDSNSNKETYEIHS